MRARIWLALAVAALAAIVVGPEPVQASGLKDDGRVGVVKDLQGTVLVQPAGRQRWSPVGPDTVLLPGDQLRAMLRGAHAAEVGLAGGGSLVLGAGGLVRLDERGRVHLVRGDAEISGGTKRRVGVTGPGGFAQQVAEAAVVVRAKDRKTTVLERAPRWLEGYRGSTTDEWMGSLVANVDGRNVPLSVGYHKVDVVIRDQIAVTTIEQSFINATPARLEGVFSFPLPAGASISGFGMWIGNELVQADIVERRRARQIYEDILRRKKDPGLLEWSGGNLFKASVFPIPAHGEKRIRLRYTQVLPLEGARLRYRYALRSEMLRTRPLEKLQITVRNHSTVALESVSSPTHDTRVTQTSHDATVEFSAEEYAPDRDFEAVFEVQRTSPLTVVPHRRGEDGYFMLLLAPPDPSAGAWERELLPEGDPLDVLFVTDTSGSMGPAERKQQRAFLEAALALLGDEDRFRLMACDATIGWVVGKAQPATEKNVDQALRALDRRASLGWSDLDQALAAAAERAGEGTLVVYLGDGIGTTGDADPVALAQRIGRMKVPAGAAFHAVATGSAYEEGVLDAIAALGGGTVRGTEGNPAGAAYALLSEVAQPSVKDLEVSFEGLRTARVYPQRLPSLAAGTQQTVLGRFLPEGGANQSGRITVTGTLSGKPVSYAADLTLAENESGNSFLPRLWARKHLDALLAEGRNPAIEEEIVSFSERFGIMTPYTSFLVLESDEDRERYGVTRRVHMRDGERFFAQGRTAAATAALRKQVRKARVWRLGLRRRMLAEISDLGRSLYVGPVGGAYAQLEFGGPQTGSGWGGGGGGSQSRSGSRFNSDAPFEGPGQYRGPAGELGLDMDNEEGDGFEDAPPWDEKPGDSREPSRPPPAPDERKDRSAEYELGARAKSVARQRPSGASGPQSGSYGGYVGQKSDFNHMPWLANLLFQNFPGVPAPHVPPVVAEPPAWDADVLAVLQAVVRAPALDEGHAGGLEVIVSETGRGVGLPDDLPGRTARLLIDRQRWFARQASAGEQALENWLTDERGALLTGTRLGRRRPGVEVDSGHWATYAQLGRTDFVRHYADWTAEIRSRDGDLVVVRLTPPGESNTEIVLTIDTAKRLVVQHDTSQGGEITSSRRVTKTQQAGGIWWPIEETTRGIDGVERPRCSRSVRELAAAEFEAALSTALGGHADVVFLPPANPHLGDAEQALHEGEATFADHLVIASNHGAYQRWDKAWDVLDKALAMEPGKPGLDWIELVLLAQSRRGEQLAAHVHRLAAELNTRTDQNARGLARLLVNQSGQLQVDERLDLIGRLADVATSGESDAERAWQRTQWSWMRATVLQSNRRWGEALEIWRQLRQDRPDDLRIALQLLGALVQSGDIDSALALGESVQSAANPWERHHARQMQQQLAWALLNAMRYDDLLAVTKTWIALQPENSQAYHARLTALLALDRVAECDAWIAAQFDTAAQAGKDRHARARLGAAVSTALGDTWRAGWHHGAFDDKWGGRLAALARTLARDPDADASIVQRIVHHGRYRSSDARTELIGWLRTDLRAGDFIQTAPVDRLQQFVHWLPWDRNSVDATVWRDVADRLAARWRRTEDENERSRLFHVALSLLDQHTEPAEAAQLLREALAAGPQKLVPGYASTLLDRLAQLPWTAATEDEMFRLVPRAVSEEGENVLRTRSFATRARWIAEQLMRLRMDAVLGPAAEREKLPRAELRERQRDAKQTCRRAVAERLAKAAADAPALLRPWYEIERVGFLAELGEDSRAAEGEAREILLSIAKEEDDDANGLNWALRERSVLALSYLAVRSDAPEGLADRVTKLLGEGLAGADEKSDWRYAIFRLLVALDRTDELESALRSWVEPARVESRWRIALGYLLAETGKLKDAAAQFEEIARLGQLGEREYVTLAAWYLVLGDESRRQDTLDRRYTTVDEQQLAQRVQQQYYKLRNTRRGEVPPDMDEEVLRVIRVMLSKTSNPGQRLGVVSNLYGTTKDFRLLAFLPDGVLGHTPAAVYPYLRATSSMLQQVHEEATCDEIRLRISERSTSARTDTDRRGLTLLMAQVERRAAEVLDQPGPHVEVALEHMKAARKGSWLPGERRLMAEYLASLARIPHASLAEEQLDQLGELHRAEPTGTRDRLLIARSLHATQWVYEQRDTAIDGLLAAFDEHRNVQGGVLPQPVNVHVDLLCGWFEHEKRFGAGETFLIEEHARQTSSAQKQWYSRRRFVLYRACLGQGGTVSHGKGEKLYRAARAEMQRALFEHASDHLQELLESYLALHRTAHKRAKIAGVGDDLIGFSRTALPELLPRFGQQQSRQALRVAETLRPIAGPLPALTLLVERLEKEPKWFGRRGQGGWAAYSYRMSKWREECGGSEIEPRLLVLVLRELERDLTTQHVRNRNMYASPGSSGFWKAKAGEFAAVAHRVIADHPQSATHLHHAAQYLWIGLHLRDDAIRTLQDADGRGALLEAGRWSLTGWLQYAKRWQEMLPHAARLVADRPDNLDYRVANVRALHGVGRDDEGRALVDATWAHFDRLAADGQHTHATAQRLGGLCFDCKYFARSVTHYTTAIRDHERQSRRSRNDSQLAHMYGYLARAHAGLNEYDEAVDAASAAVVVRGRSTRSRGRALGDLTSVLEAIPDLPAWAAKYEREAAETGLDAPVIRRALAKIMMQRKQPGEALRHLRAALRHYPDDVELHSAVIQAYKALDDQPAATAAMLDSLFHVPAQAALYEQVAVRFRDAGDEQNSERALTGLAEFAPNEAEGHRFLAQLRTRAGRHADAVTQWRQVVRIRTLELAGWLELAQAQARAGDREAAHATLDDLLATSWGPQHRRKVEQISKWIDQN